MSAPDHDAAGHTDAGGRTWTRIHPDVDLWVVKGMPRYPRPLTEVIAKYGTDPTTSAPDHDAGPDLEAIRAATKPGDVIDEVRDTVLGECGHTMAGQEWREDWRMCQPCENGDDLRAEVDRLNADAAALRAEVERLTTNHTVMRTSFEREVSALTADRDAARARVEELEAELSAWKADFNTLARIKAEQEDRLQAELTEARAGLRRFDDRDGDVWTETAPGSGRYRHGEIVETRDEAEREFGPLTDLAPIPAGDEEGQA